MNSCGAPGVYRALVLEREDVDVGEAPAVRLEARPEVADHRGELLVGADHRRARRACERLAAAEQRRPAVAPTRDPVEHDLGVPTEPEPRVRLRHRTGLDDLADRLEVAAVVGEVVGRPDPLQYLDRLVEEGVALLEVDAERGELRSEIAGAEREDRPPAGEYVDRGHGPRHQQRVPVRNDREVRHQIDAVRDCGAEAERHERVEGLVTSAVEPLLEGAGMIGERDGVDSGRLRGTGELGDVVGGEPRPPSASLRTGHSTMNFMGGILSRFVAERLVQQRQRRVERFCGDRGRIDEAVEAEPAEEGQRDLGELAVGYFGCTPMVAYSSSMSCCTIARDRWALAASFARASGWRLAYSTNSRYSVAKSSSQNMSPRNSCTDTRELFGRVV